MDVWVARMNLIKIRREWPVTGLALAAMLAVPAASALTVDYGLGFGGEYSTNVYRTAEDPEGDFVASTWAGLGLEQESAVLAARLVTGAEYRGYLEAEDDDILFNLAAAVDWTISPQRFVWHLENYFQQIRQDVLSPASPDNRQDSNIFWTGPDLSLRLSQLYSVGVGARYGDFYYAETGGDNTRLAVLGRFSRLLSEYSEIHLSAQTQAVEYENSGEIGSDGVRITNFDQVDVFAGYIRETPLTRIRADIGRTFVDREGLPDVEGPLAAISIARTMAHSSELGVTLISRLTESGAALLSSGGDRLGVAGGSQTVQDMSYENRVDVFYTTLRAGTDWGIRVFARDQDYEFSPLDRETVGAVLDASRPLANRWLGSAAVAYALEDFPLLDREDRRVTVTVGAQHRLSRRISIDFSVVGDRQTSSVDTRDFDDLTAQINLRYGERPSWGPR